MAKLKVLTAIGTRPELIKLAPVMDELRARPDEFELRILFTAQHREMLDQMAAFFDIQPDVDLDVMTIGQELSDLTGRVLTGLTTVLRAESPDIVLAQGDTTTVMAAALACSYLKLPFGHVEAGLRTGEKYNPFPEEINRRLVSQLADLHFAPTDRDRDALLAENVRAEAIQITGNTIIDAVMGVAERDIAVPIDLAPDQDLVLLTMHRRESFGEKIEEVFQAINELAHVRPHLKIVYPVHPNPNVRRAAHRRFEATANVALIDPLEYGEFVALMKRATLILTDSGGIQEEAPSLDVPVLVLREVTERPQAVEAGSARLVGTDKCAILENALELLDSRDARAEMTAKVNPFGDGRASQRIVDAILRFFQGPGAPEPAATQD